MNNCPPLTKRALVLFLGFALVFATLLSLPNHAHATGNIALRSVALFVDPPQHAGYSLSPTSGVQGSIQDITITNAQCLAGAAGAPTLAGVQVFAPTGSGISVSNVSVPAAGAGVCSIVVRFAIAASAPIGPVKISLFPPAGPAVAALTVLDFAVTGIPAGPIPPQLNNQGQVDVMWNVVPKAIIDDNFGGRIAKQYYAIDVVIGNDSGYDLQLASIGFTVPSLTLGNLKYKIPATGYRLVRGSLQSRQELGARFFIVNAVKIAGPILTGFTPFFHNANHKANFSEAINILSNPFEKGLDAIFPDIIPEELNRLADQAFRDDVSTKTVIPNNVQARILTFVPKKVLFPQKKPSGCASPQRTVIPAVVPAAIPAGCLDENNMQDVMLMLGEIVLIGDQVSHVNRIRVVSTPLGPTPTDFTVSGRVSDGCNNGVGGVTMTINAGSGFVSRQVTTSPDGTYTFSNVPAGRTYTVTATLSSIAGATFPPTASSLSTFTLDGDQTNVDFSAMGVAVISGRTTTAAGAALPGVTVAAGPAGATVGSTTSDAQGNFSVVVPLVAPATTVNVTATRPAVAGAPAPAAVPAQTWSCANSRLTFVMP
jgi:hypothetical protein